MATGGRVIFLNGLTSSGKTSIIGELAARGNLVFYRLSFDMFEETLPEWLACDEAYYSGAIVAMYCAARSLAQQGHDVLLDGIIMNISGLEHHYDTLKELLRDCDLHIVDVHCPLEVCRRRNIARGDRREYQSLEQSRIAEQGVIYDLSIDTGAHTVPECADMIAEHYGLRRR